jgi:hypothetical protein
LSGNTFGAVLWSDGKLEVPMMPDRSPAGVCPHCSHSFLWRDVRDEGDYDFSDVRGSGGAESRFPVKATLVIAALASWVIFGAPVVAAGLVGIAFVLGVLSWRRKGRDSKPAISSPVAKPPLSKPATEATYLKLAERSDLSDSERRDLRVFAMWCANDPSRKSKRPPPRQELSDAAVSNLSALSRLLNPEEDQERLMKAGVVRQLGAFGECIELLERPFKDARLQEHADFLRLLAEQGDPRILPFPSKES